jgi:hypothetical protein
MNVSEKDSESQFPRLLHYARICPLRRERDARARWLLREHPGQVGVAKDQAHFSVDVDMGAANSATPFDRGLIYDYFAGMISPGEAASVIAPILLAEVK